MLRTGDKVPSFLLKGVNREGKRRSFSNTDFVGKRIVLYFYQRDMNPDCSIEACSFRDHVKCKDCVQVVGISGDNVDRHFKFMERYGLNFILLSDEKHELAKLFGAWCNRKNRIANQTFLIDENGVISKEWRRVDVAKHSDEVFKYLD